MDATASAVDGVEVDARPWTLEALYRAHAKDVARWAARLAGPELDVEDLVHEVFVVAEAKLDGFRGDGAVTTWLFRITHNVVRRERRRARWSKWWRPESEVELTDDRELPEEIAARRADVRRLYRALDRMSEKLRTALILSEIEGRPAKEIAELLGITENTVWVRVHRGKKELARRLGGSS